MYSQAPFAGPRKLVDYLGRYTHRVAISNHRILGCEDGQVRYHYRDRRDGDRLKTDVLPAEEFLTASCSTCCRTASCASGITACWPIASSGSNWPGAANCWEPTRRRPRTTSPTRPPTGWRPAGHRHHALSLLRRPIADHRLPRPCRISDHPPSPPDNAPSTLGHLLKGPPRCLSDTTPKTVAACPAARPRRGCARSGHA